MQQPDLLRGARVALFAAAAGVLLPSASLCAESSPPSDTQARADVLWEWSAYYSSVGLHVPLADDALPDGGEMQEWEVYRELARRTFEPRTLLLEASVNPMPIAGVWLRGHRPGFYEDTRLGRTSLVESLTTGFPEPWALSAFLGNQMRFSKQGERTLDTNRGYMGYLLSLGTKHIHRNVLIDSDWAEFEWKLKGERRFKGERLSWSFRVGAKLFSNHEIADLYYFGMERSTLDFSGAPSWLANSRIRLKTELTRHHTQLAQQEVILGRKLPLDSKHVALALEFGLIYERGVKYSGTLATPGAHNLTFVIRPNIEF